MVESKKTCPVRSVFISLAQTYSEWTPQGCCSVPGHSPLEVFWAAQLGEDTQNLLERLCSKSHVAWEHLGIPQEEQTDGN